MTTMRRVWVDQSVYSDYTTLYQWLAEQGLSRFWTEVRREDSRVQIDVHELPPEPVTSSVALATGSKDCTAQGCQVCPPGARSGQLDHEQGPFTLAWTEGDNAPTQFFGPISSEPEASYVNQDAGPLRWDKPLRVVDDTGSFPVLTDRKPLPWADVLTYTVAVLLGLVGAFLIVRGWYMRYGCPFLPDNGVLNACKALVVQVGKR